MRAWVLVAVLLSASFAGCLEGGEPLTSSAGPASEDADVTSNGTSSEPSQAGRNASGASEETASDTTNRTTGPDDAPEEAQPRVPVSPAVVIAVIDTGINLYHEAFRAPDRWTSPDRNRSPLHTRLGLDAQPVPLSLDANTYDDAVEADEEALRALEPRTLYTFPGTKLLGAISFEERSGNTPVILDQRGHGTMTSSRAVGNTISIGGADPGIWLVAVQGFELDAIRWATEQDWIDMISISSGLSLLGLAPGPANVMERETIQVFEDASHTKPLFASSGNGVGNAGLAGFPSWLRGASGVPDAISVGANDNERLSHWHNQDSYVAADGCANPAADTRHLSRTGDHGAGTSSATPFTAGGAAKLLLEARRILQDTELGPRVDESLSAPEGAWESGYEGDEHIVLARGSPEAATEGPLADGVFTQRELKDVLYHTALPTPTEDDSDGERCGLASNGEIVGATYVPASTVPEDARWPFQGYGEVNAKSIQRATELLAGLSELPERATEDAHYERAHTSKGTLVNQQPEAPIG